LKQTNGHSVERLASSEELVDDFIMRTWRFLAVCVVIAGFVACERREGGPVGISVGSEAFKSTLVSSLVGWVQFGVYDTTNGPEIAVLNYDQITFLDPKTFAVRRTVPVGDQRVGSKQLVSLRADGALNLMAPGGGYSDVGWFDMEGRELWKFKVKSQYDLPPHKMIATDLDGDGTKEFYVADGEGVFRLDSEGKVVWRGAATGNNYMLTLPAEKNRRAAVVTEEGMWDARGNLLQKGIKSPSDNYQLQAVKWGDSCHLASGQTSSEGGRVFVFDLNGNKVFEQSIGNWGVNDILAVRFKAAEPPYLVVVGGRGAGTRRMSLNIFARDGTLVYREIRDAEALLVIPDDLTGIDTLLLCTGGLKKLEKL
jgi:hypothetical protein